jgi:hypothetical protein
MSEATRLTRNPAQPIPEYLGAFFTLHIDGFQEILDKHGGWGDALRTYYKYLEKQFVLKHIYQSVSECFGFGCDREYLEDTYLIENPSAFALLQRESGIHAWKETTTGGDYEFKVHIEVVPLIPTEDSSWRNNSDIKLEKFTTYGAGAP